MSKHWVYAFRAGEADGDHGNRAGRAAAYSVRQPPAAQQTNQPHGAGRGDHQRGHVAGLVHDVLREDPDMVYEGLLTVLLRLVFLLYAEDRDLI